MKKSDIALTIFVIYALIFHSTRYITGYRAVIEETDEITGWRGIFIVK